MIIGYEKRLNSLRCLASRFLVASTKSDHISEMSVKCVAL